MTLNVFPNQYKGGSTPVKASGESPKALNIPLVNDEGGSRFEVSLVEEGEKGGGQRRALSQGSGEPGGERQTPGKHTHEEIRNLAALAQRQNLLLDRLYPVDEASGKEFFRKLGVGKPNEYRSGYEVFSSLRSFALTSEGSAVGTWFLTFNPSSRGPDALYVHIDDKVVPVGLAVCKLQRGTYLGYYTTSTDWKNKLGL